MSHIRSFFVGTALLVGTVATANTGTINVDISTAPGEIELDGFPTGQTAPAVIDSVAPGEHLIELEYGCMVGSSTVTVYRDQEATAEILLENRGGEGTVRLRGVPRSGAVFFDESPLEGIDTGVQVACGGHRVRVEASGFEDWESMVVVTSGRWVTLQVSMVEGQIEERSGPADIQQPEVSGDWDDEGDDWGDEEDWDEPEGPSRDDLARAERDSRSRAAADRRAAEEADRARREAEAAERSRIEEEERERREEARRAAEAEVLRLEEEASQARARLEMETYGDLDSLDGPSAADEHIEDEFGEEEIYEEEYDDEFSDEDTWDDEYREYSDSSDDFDNDFGSTRSIRGASNGKPVFLARLTTIAGLGGLGFGAYSYLSYQDAAEAWVLVADEYGPTSLEATTFWSQNAEPRYVTAIASFVAGGLLTTVGGGLYVFKVMGDDGGFVGFTGEW